MSSRRTRSAGAASPVAPAAKAAATPKRPSAKAAAAPAPKEAKKAKEEEKKARTPTPKKKSTASLSAPVADTADNDDDNDDDDDAPEEVSVSASRAVALEQLAKERGQAERVQHELKQKRKERDERLKTQKLDKRARLLETLPEDVLRAAAAQELLAAPTASGRVAVDGAARPAAAPRRRAVPAAVRVSQHVAVMPLTAPEVSTLPKPIPAQAAAFAQLKLGGAGVRRVGPAHMAAGKKARMAPTFRRAVVAT